jgi:hypothetical protein
MALDPTQIGAMIAAVGALGTAASALVDATKIGYRGGVSNIGYSFIADALAPYDVALRLVDAQNPYATIHANWINGVPKADQKATAKALIRLGLTPATAPVIAASSPGVDGATLQSAATNVANGESLTPQQIGVLGRLDATIDARLDAGFERAEQKYRNTSRVIAGVFAVILAVVGGWIVVGGPLDVYLGSKNLPIALLVGVIAVPLAPIAKDITSAIGTAVKAFKSVRGG